MKKVLIASVLSIASLVSTSVMASDLEKHMNTLASSFSSFNKAKTPTAALTALTQMKNASNASKATLPSDLRGLAVTDPKVQAYQALYNQMNAQIDRAIVLTKAGKLNEAKQITKQIDAIKMKGHSTYY